MRPPRRRTIVDSSPFPVLLARSGGFTLVEILSALVVLILIVGVISQVASMTIRATRMSNQALDAASQARLVFGRIGADIAGAVKRTDAPWDLQNPGKEGLYLRFLSAVPSEDGTAGASANRGFSLVAYQIAAHADNNGRDCLVRAGKAISRNMSGYLGLDAKGLPVRFTSAGFPAGLLPASGEYDILSPGVIRMVVGYQLYPDNLQATLQDGTVVPNARGQVVYSSPVRSVTPFGGGTVSVYPDLTRISAVVIGLVVIDADNLKLMNAAQVAALAGAFADPTGNALPVGVWNTVANNPSALPAAVPWPARQAVRVFQCAFPLTPLDFKP
ncbi:MAG: type II secretion system protein J [Chthoniobacteraceae bacterium]